MIDEFTLAEQNAAGLRTIPIKETTTFQTYVTCRKDTALSGPSEFFISVLRKRMGPTHRAMTAA